MPYRLILDDGGRNLSKRRLQTNDCVVRAFAIATQTDYDLTYEVLARAGRQCSQGFDITTYLARKRSFLGRPFKHITFRSHTTVDETIAACQWGRVVIDLEDHVMALIDGSIRDLIRMPGDTPVLGIWRFT